MKKMLAFGAAATALAFVPAGIAHATTSTSSTSTSITIDYYADFDFAGTNVDVGLQVRCKDPSGTGVLDVLVEQAPPETPAPVGVGTGPATVVCDGKTRAAGATVVGALFDVGKAKATATLVTTSGTKRASAPIYIRVV
ncbi:MAG TPA: hypothetical protein VFH03_25085 [Actinoplanes sp.]|nr:hypothetical protein [Actinoplanes sp.]